MAQAPRLPDSMGMVRPSKPLGPTPSLFPAGNPFVIPTTFTGKVVNPLSNKHLLNTAGMPSPKGPPPSWTGQSGVQRSVPASTGAGTGSNANSLAAAVSGLTGSVPNVPSQYQTLFQQVLAKALGLYNAPNPAAQDLLNPSQIISPGLTGAVINPTQVGKDAGLGYQAAINQDNQNIANTQTQNAQDLQDIQSWFGQLGAAQQGASKNDASALAQQLAGSQDAAKAFLSAMGGDANLGSSNVANAASIADAGLQGQGLAQGNFDNVMSAIDTLNKAQQLTNQTNIGNNQVLGLREQLASDKLNQGAATAQAKDNAQQQLFSQLSSLANLKSNLAGNLFNEQSGLRTEKLNELAGLSNTILGTALAIPQIQAATLSNQGAAANIAGKVISNAGQAAEVKNYIATNGGSGNATIGTAQPGIRQQVATGFTTLGGQFLNANGGLKMAPPMIRQALMSALTQTQGWKNDPSLQAFVNGVTQQLLTGARVKAWDKSHGTNYYSQGQYTG